MKSVIILVVILVSYLERELYIKRHNQQLIANMVLNVVSFNLHKYLTAVLILLFCA